MKASRVVASATVKTGRMVGTQSVMNSLGQKTVTTGARTATTRKPATFLDRRLTMAMLSAVEATAKAWEMPQEEVCAAKQNQPAVEAMMMAHKLVYSLYGSYHMPAAAFNKDQSSIRKNVARIDELAQVYPETATKCELARNLFNELMR